MGHPNIHRSFGGCQTQLTDGIPFGQLSARGRSSSQGLWGQLTLNHSWNGWKTADQLFFVVVFFRRWECWSWQISKATAVKLGWIWIWMEGAFGMENYNSRPAHKGDNGGGERTSCKAWWWWWWWWWWWSWRLDYDGSTLSSLHSIEYWPSCSTTSSLQPWAPSPIFSCDVQGFR